mmetsp:Transcript_8863/g.20938  ORF Transcript_8863/g.20938 Transcript_8863/m.20938 type:complete len:227 (-) Transcript_8863:625-1305(-)
MHHLPPLLEAFDDGAGHDAVEEEAVLLAGEEDEGDEAREDGGAEDGARDRGLEPRRPEGARPPDRESPVQARDLHVDVERVRVRVEERVRLRHAVCFRRRFHLEMHLRVLKVAHRSAPLRHLRQIRYGCDKTPKLHPGHYVPFNPRDLLRFHCPFHILVHKHWQVCQDANSPLDQVQRTHDRRSALSDRVQNCRLLARLVDDLQPDDPLVAGTRRDHRDDAARLDL